MSWFLSCKADPLLATTYWVTGLRMILQPHIEWVKEQGWGNLSQGGQEEGREHRFLDHSIDPKESRRRPGYSAEYTMNRHHRTGPVHPIPLTMYRTSVSIALSVAGIKKLGTRQSRVWIPALYCGAMQRPASFYLQILGLWNFAVCADDAREPPVPLKMSSSAALPSGFGPSQLTF